MGEAQSLRAVDRDVTQETDAHIQESHVMIGSLCGLGMITSTPTITEAINAIDAEYSKKWREVKHRTVGMWGIKAFCLNCGSIKRSGFIKRSDRH
jgi:hypothetical protein